MRIKLQRALGLSAILGCAFCHMTQHVVRGRQHWVGIAMPAVALRGQRQGTALQVGQQQEGQRLCSDQDMRDRGNTAERPAPPELHMWIGAHARCAFDALLWYMQPREVFFIPFAHTFYRGVLRDFMMAILMTPHQLRVKTKQAATLRAPAGADGDQAMEDATADTTTGWLP
jgi:hypothetical protein